MPKGPIVDDTNGPVQDDPNGPIVHDPKGFRNSETPAEIGLQKSVDMKPKKPDRPPDERQSEISALIQDSDSD